MKLANITEASYYKGASSKAREQLIHNLQKNIGISYVDTSDDWRVTLDVAPIQDEDQYDYDIVRSVLTRMYGEATLEDGYSTGTFQKNIIPTWVVDHHKIEMTPTSDDVMITITEK